MQKGDRSVDELTKDFNKQVSLKRAATLSSEEFEKHSEKIREELEHEVIKTNTNGKRIRHNSVATEQEAQEASLDMYSNQGKWGYFVKVQSQLELAEKSAETEQEQDSSQPPAKKSRGSSHSL